MFHVFKGTLVVCVDIPLLCNDLLIYLLIRSLCTLPSLNPKHKFKNIEWKLDYLNAFRYIGAFDWHRLTEVK